jgi:coenzyme F420 biosynthesis associated uncharacterized protein
VADAPTARSLPILALVDERLTHPGPHLLARDRFGHGERGRGEREQLRAGDGVSLGAAVPGRQHDAGEGRGVDRVDRGVVDRLRRFEALGPCLHLRAHRPERTVSRARTGRTGPGAASVENVVDWTLARQIARFIARDSHAPVRGLDLERRVQAAEEHVGRYTELRPEEPLPGPEAIDRREWAEINLQAFERMLAPVTERLGDRMSSVGPLAGPLQTVAGMALAAEVGLLTGYVSQRILGQYELSLLDAEVPPRLLFVAPNLERAVEELGVDRDSFLDWIALHELTHALQFSGVPWLRDHLGGLLREYLESVEVRIERGVSNKLPSLPDPAELVARFREGGIAALVQTKEQQEIFDRIQAAMAVVEGYSEHVMDAVGEDVLPAYAGLRDAMERRRRSRSAPERLLQRLLGLDMKMRQYELGKRFSDAVVERSGIAGLNRVWAAPEALPTLHELTRPERWVARVERDPAAA